jgi:hypothetical protein
MWVSTFTMGLGRLVCRCGLCANDCIACDNCLWGSISIPYVQFIYIVPAAYLTRTCSNAIPLRPL